MSGGRLSAVRSYIRSTLLEGVYRPIGTSNGCVLLELDSDLLSASMFPETGNWLGAADE